MKRNLLSMIVVVLCVFATSISAKPSEKQLKLVANGMVEALNSNDLKQREIFLLNHYINADSASAIERWQGHFLRYNEILGNIQIHEIDLSDSALIKLLIKTTNPRAISQWSYLIINMDSETPEKFRSFGLEPAQDPKIVLPNRPLTDDEIKYFVGQFIDDLVSRDVFSGSVILTKEGKEVFSGTYGEADKQWHIKNNLETKFNLGSMNKMFTGVAICQLVEKGKLDFDATVGTYLPEYPNKDIREKVKIHHLLTHTSGMDSYWDAMAKMDWTALRTVEDFARLSYNDSLLFEPGAEFHYSNAGPLVLGLIIEKVTDMDYHDYIREHVTGPAGMVNTDCYNNDDIIPNLAHGYYWDDEMNVYHSNIFEHSARGSAAGGGYSTAIDLQRFAKALYDGTLLSPEMLKTYTTGKVEMGPNDFYAYLISEEVWDGIKSVGHGGGAPGINSDLKIFPEIGYTISAMSNYDTGASAIGSYVAHLLAHGRPAITE